MELSLHRLRMLQAVARHGSVTAAARALHYSPSAISQQLAALEEGVGAPVLERIGRGVRLTLVGRVLAEHAEVLLAAEQEACAAVEQVRQSDAAELTVGVFATVAAGLLPTVMAELAEHHPQLHLRTREVDPDQAVIDLRQGQLDLAFLVDYPDAPVTWPTNLRIVPLLLDPLYLAARAGQFPASGVVDLADLADHDWIISGPHTSYGRAVIAACQRAGFELRTAHEVDEQATALAMVDAGIGITLMSELGSRAFQPRNVERIALSSPINRRVLLAHHQAAAHRPALQAAIASITRAAEILFLRGTTDPQRDGS